MLKVSGMNYKLNSKQERKTINNFSHGLVDCTILKKNSIFVYYLLIVNFFDLRLNHSAKLVNLISVYINKIYSTDYSQGSDYFIVLWSVSVFFSSSTAVFILLFKLWSVSIVFFLLCIVD